MTVSTVFAGLAVMPPIVRAPRDGRLLPLPIVMTFPVVVLVATVRLAHRGAGVEVRLPVELLLVASSTRGSVPLPERYRQSRSKCCRR